MKRENEYWVGKSESFDATTLTSDFSYYSSSIRFRSTFLFHLSSDERDAVELLSFILLLSLFKTLNVSRSWPLIIVRANLKCPWRSSSTFRCRWAIFYDYKLQPILLFLFFLFFEQGKADGQRSAVWFRARLQDQLCQLGSFLQMHAGKVLFVSLLALATFCVALKSVQVHSKIDQLWIQGKFHPLN